ncbi:tRNA pseudouridine(38-40) synthase TruA [Candidatus Aerophobetes bacterium]|uniref:tRNA pseudouridine synthase A n=1 Tax=Aerophobetes bacterium TaxID=2030807 RepID=A0A2A4YE61_UNCAE|nr:MAG: tRNA pseudouridine(38-40) synthase TruA [Candidatus Aerophobetes bacterium]
MKNIKLTLCYDGTHFHGWQKTFYPSIEEELAKALLTALQQRVKLQAASRTDAGVHAEGQIVNFILEENSVDLHKLQYSLNQLLPSSILVKEIEIAEDSFHPTTDATGKEYEYRLTTSKYLDPFKRNSHWHFPKKLDLDLMNDAAKLLIGKKDFKALTNFKIEPYTDTIRTLYRIEIREDKDDFLITILGDHFLYKMARNIAGLICYVGAGKIPLEDVENVLAQKLRKNAGMTAPAKGLTLKKIYYKNTIHAFAEN